jgi:hypothetical protein
MDFEEPVPAKPPKRWAPVRIIYTALAVLLACLAGVYYFFIA